MGLNRGYLVGEVQLISGGAKIAQRYLEIATRAEGTVALEAFRTRATFWSAFGAALPDETKLVVSTSKGKELQYGWKTLKKAVPDVEILKIGDKKAHTITHAKSISTPDEALASTAVLDGGDPTRLDWALYVRGDQARAIHDVNLARHSGDEIELLAAQNRARAVQVFYNDPTTEVLYATEALEAAIRGARANDPLDIAVKEIKERKFISLVGKAFDDGAHGEVVTTDMTTKRTFDLLDELDIPNRVNDEDLAKLHGNMYVIGDQLLLGTVYPNKRPLGRHATKGSVELLIGTRDPVAVAQAREAIHNIPS